MASVKKLINQSVRFEDAGAFNCQPVESLCEKEMPVFQSFLFLLIIGVSVGW